MEANHSLTGADLKEWREVQHLSQEELGELLGRSREWIGKLERGERAVSAEIYMIFERVRREPRFSLKGNQQYPSAPPDEAVGVNELDLIDPQHSRPEAIRQEIRSLIESGIKLAGEDVARLGWLLYQAQDHMKPPNTWSRVSVKDRETVQQLHHRLVEETERRLTAPGVESEHHAS